MFKKVSMCIIFLLQFAFLQSVVKADSIGKVLWYTNEIRAIHGLSPFYALEPLMNGAGSHAADMAVRNYFSHYTPEGWSPSMRANGWGFYGGVGENIACGNPNPGQVVATWMESPGHRANILNPYYTHIGVGHYWSPKSGCQHYWVQKFGSY